VLRIVHTGRKNLHGNITMEVLVTGAIDIFHTTDADRLGDALVAQFKADG